MLKHETRKIDILLNLTELTTKIIDQTALKAELVVLGNFIKQDVASLNEISNCFIFNKIYFQCFFNILDIALLLPTSTAKVESCFSAFTRILRPQRKNMKH